MNYIQNILLSTLVFVKDKLEDHDQELLLRKKIFSNSWSINQPDSQAATGRNAEDENKSTGSSENGNKDKKDLA